MKVIALSSVVVPLLLLATVALAESPTIQLGRYSAVTESEWSLDLDLAGNGVAALKIASWNPGERNLATIRIYAGTWRLEKMAVTVRFKDGEAVFNYNHQLSFQEFGRDGAAPGLVGASATVEPPLLVGRSLWLDHELRKLKW